MKIIGIDNLNRETIADKLWLDSILNTEVHFAQRVCDKLNERLGDGGGTFYKIVADDYYLSRGMEDLI